VDRGSATSSFVDLFSEVKVLHVQTTKSDHCCLIIDCLQEADRGKNGRKSFRYENMWRRDPSYMDLVETVWGNGADIFNMEQLQGSLESLQRSLREWETSVFGQVKKELCRIRKELESVRRASVCSGPSRQEKRLMARLSERLSREECIEKQRSRITWLKEGDRNTSFFQATARGRAKTNKIAALRKVDGSLTTSRQDIEKIVVEF
jgi:hypothetical protein